METRDYKRVIRFLEGELEPMLDKAERSQSVPAEDVELMKCMLSGIAKSETIIAMRESGYSGRGYSYADGEPMIDYRRNDGPNYSGRDDMRGDYRGDGSRREYRNNYRRGDGDKEKMIARLKERARNERDDRRRETIEDMIRDMESDL